MKFFHILLLLLLVLLILPVLLILALGAGLSGLLLPLVTGLQKLLLALLFSLSKMSRSNEIISMLTAGCSVIRVIFPLLIIGVLASVALVALNYEFAPHAEGIKRPVESGGSMQPAYRSVARTKAATKAWRFFRVFAPLW